VIAMTFNPYDPNAWGSYFKPLIIAHDVGRSRDRSTAVVGGSSPFDPTLIGIKEADELTQGLYGSARARELAVTDRRYDSNALIVTDLSSDPTYAEPLFEMFAPRVIGLQISRHGDGRNVEHRLVKHGSIPVYTVGSNFCIPSCSPIGSKLLIHQRPGGRMSNLWRLRPKSARAGLFILARPGSTMISAYRSPCWYGRHVIRT